MEQVFSISKVIVMNYKKVKALRNELTAMARHVEGSEKHQVMSVATQLHVALTDYQKYFEQQMKKHKIDDIGSLDRSAKKKFFEAVDKGWKADSE
jgi:hypothetical protein